MKKLLYLFLALAIVGCTKDELEIPSVSGDALSFIISDDLSTRADTDKEAWEEGESLAIFAGSDDAATSKEYYVKSVDKDGKATLAPVDGVVGFLDDGSSTSFTAYYPYVKDRTLSGYKAQTDNADVIVSTGSPSSGTVSFASFSHMNTHVTFNFTAGREYIDNGFESIYLELRDGTTTLWSTTIEDLDDATTASYSLYCSARSSLSNVKLYMVGNDKPDAYVVDFSADSEVSAWVAGTPYVYNNFMIGSADIAYNGSTYQIYTALGLEAFAALVNGSSEPEGLLYSGSNFAGFSSAHNSIAGVLMNDIDLSTVCGAEVGGDGGTNWTPIGSYSDSNKTYTGTFDGGGYEVSGLYINASSSNHQGLFGYISGATIKNLGVSGSVTGSDYVGGVVGRAESTSMIIGCYNNATVTASADNAYVGGIVGYSNGATIVACYNSGSITGSNSSGGQTPRVGGIVGYSNGATVTSCYSYGTVTVSGSSNYIGGVVGQNSGSANYCYYDTTVAGEIGAVNGSDNDTTYCGLSTDNMKGEAGTEGTLLYYLNQSGYSYYWKADTKNINNGYPILSWQ